MHLALKSEEGTIIHSLGHLCLYCCSKTDSYSFLLWAVCKLVTETVPIELKDSGEKIYTKCAKKFATKLLGMVNLLTVDY